MQTPVDRLMRSRTDKIIAGVSGGIARYLDIDVVLVRLAFVLMALGGVGFLIYPILWVIMPPEPQGVAPSNGSIDPATQAVFVADGVTRRVRFDPMTGQPLDPDQEIPIQNLNPSQGVGSADPQTRRNRILGVVLLAFGGFLALHTIVPIGLIPFIFPVILIGLGVMLIRRAEHTN